MITLGFLKFPSNYGKYDNNLELFEEIKDFINDYVDLPLKFTIVTAVYIMMSWIYNNYKVIPYLRVIGDYGTGKSRFLETVGNLTYKAIMAGGSTSVSSLFRTLDSIKGTLILDEADFKHSDISSEITKILNSGYTPITPVTRMKADKNNGSFEIEIFYVFGPKVIASRERFKDNALESRCLTFQMFIKKNIGKPSHLPKDFNARAESIRNKLLSFRFNNFQPNLEVDESIIDSIEFPRVKQTILSLAHTAKMINDKVLKSVIDFALEYEKNLIKNESSTLEADILRSTYSLINEAKYERLYIGEITERFNLDYLDQYVGRGLFQKETNLDFTDGKELSANRISARKVGAILDKLGLKKERDRSGFYISSREFSKFEPLFERFGVNEKSQNFSGKSIKTIFDDGEESVNIND